MFRRNKNYYKDLERMSRLELEKVPLAELQRIANKRWALGLEELYERVQGEIERRDPRKNWKCTRCDRTHFHEKEVRVTGSFWESMLGWELNKYHVIVCNYCSKSEFYNVQMVASEQAFGFWGN